MSSFFYDLCLLLFALFCLPKWLWEIAVKGKYRKNFAMRLGLKLPRLSLTAARPVIWIHTVSMGETRAVLGVFKRLQTHYPEATFVVSTTTETGQAEAKRIMPQAACHFFLPLDFSWTMRRLFKRIKPDYLILCESDFWLNFLLFAKKSGAQVALVNGKISARSARRFAYFPSFSRRLFSCFDRLCVQNRDYASSFEQLGALPSAIAVTGNLKCDAQIALLTEEQKSALRSELGLRTGELVITVGSTHAPEEAQLIPVFEELWKKFPHLKVILVPRHPERFNEVEALLVKLGHPPLRFSQREAKNGRERVILIDAMGQLLKCYQISDLAIVAGSFATHVGGHNVLEPVQCGTPTFFGPHMFSQPDLVSLVLSAKAGRQVELEALPAALLELLESPEKRAAAQVVCQTLTNEARGSLERTWQALKPLLK